MFDKTDEFDRRMDGNRLAPDRQVGAMIGSRTDAPDTNYATRILSDTLQAQLKEYEQRRQVALDQRSTLTEMIDNLSIAIEAINQSYAVLQGPKPTQAGNARAY